jgi:hypothetical protein
MSAHTPGPWTIGVPNNKTECDIGIHGGDESPYIIADLQTDGYDDETQDANARLIAAAPELLSSLREVMGWYIEGGHAVPRIYIERANAAIAKAEGVKP